ncbi:MAG TPA: biotin/lipoyl-containing protein [Candidatus Limnocylindrales bacterium]|nr:biotin/lipoyl-containing protein [Candidatus Limnocylindrales bacterium]
MAALKGPHATPGGVSATLPGDGSAARAGAVAVDPRAVRVSLGRASASVGLTPITVGPPNPRRGSTGRSAAAEARGPAGDGRGAALRWLDPERAVVARPGRPAERVLLLPVEPPADRRAPVHREVVVGGWRIEVELERAATAALRARAQRGREERGHSGPAEVRAIIPGVVVSVSVTAGDEVVAGQQLLAVEAMKMQNELRAPRDGVIERVAVGPGTTIEVGDLLLVIS